MLILVLISFFMISLQSFYSHEVQAPIYAVCGVILCMLLAAYKILKRESVVVSGYLVAFLFFYFLSFGFSLMATLGHGGELSVTRALGYFVCICAIFAVGIIIQAVSLSKVLFFLISVHAFVFYSQFILYYGFGFAFDPLLLIMGYKQSGWGGSFEHEILGKFIRFGGLYNEPGTYSTYMAPVIALFSRYRKKSASNHFLFLAALMSLVLTFSVFGVVFCAIISVVVYRRHIVYLAAAFLPIFLVLVYPYVRYRFVNFAASGGDSGFGFRMHLLNSIFNFISEDIWGFIFGAGLALPEKISIVGAVNDVGLIIYLVAESGVFLAILFFVFMCFLSYRGGASVMAASVIILISKVSIFSPFFCLIIVLMIKESALIRKCDCDFLVRRSTLA